MRIAVIGYGRQGKAAVEYWGKDNDITVCDSKESLELPDGVESQLGKDYLHDLDRFHLIVRSPLVHPRDIVAANGERILKKVTTVTEEFMRVCPAPIIGVTGTKGKGTTSITITKILEAAGKKVHLGGNIGIAPLEMLKQDIKPSDWVVLELANFQLIDLGISPKIAVCLLVVPEHLDWHTDLAEYITSKQNLFRHQRDTDLAIFNRMSDYSTEVAGVSPALKLSYEVPEPGATPTDRNGAYVLGDEIYMDDEKVCSVNDVKLLGRHSLQNVCAAIAATWELIDHNPEVIKKGLANVHDLPHRLEKVRELNGVTFYNDSFATATGATNAAIAAVTAPKVLVVGGYDRKMEVESLIKGITSHTEDIRKVLLIGQSAPRVKEALEQAGFTNFLETDAKNIDEIVQAAVQSAQPGDAVLFSPGFASFGMFKDFEDRGLQYKAAVNAL